MDSWIDLGIAMVLVWISKNDLEDMTIPNEGIGILMVLGVIYAVSQPAERMDLLAGFFLFGGLLLGLYMLTSGEIIGAGDIKLLAVCGLRLGFDGVAAAFLLGASLGVLVQVIRKRFFGGNQAFPMAPYLSFGIIWMLFP